MAEIKSWCLEADTIRPTPIVNGTIHMEGVFSWEEWVAIRELFMRMRSRPVPCPVLPSKAEIIARIQAEESPESLARELSAIPRRLTDQPGTSPAIEV